MENNEPPQPPPQPASPPRTPQNTLLIYNYNPPYDPNSKIFLNEIRFPFNITLYNFNINNTHLYFTVTRHSILIAPLRVAQNHNNAADDDDNNGPEGLDPMRNDDNERDNNNNNEAGEARDLVPNEIVVDNDDDDVNDDNNDNDNDEHVNDNVEIGFHKFPDMDGIEQYGISLRTLPTLPVYINIANNNLVFLINSGPSVHFIRPAPPLPINPIDDAENNEVAIFHSMTTPLGLRFTFNDPNTKTVINVFLRVSGTNIRIHASTQKGVTHSVAYLVMIAPEP